MNLSDLVLVIVGILILTNHTSELIDLVKLHPVATGIIVIIIALID